MPAAEFGDLILRYLPPVLCNHQFRHTAASDCDPELLVGAILGQPVLKRQKARTRERPSLSLIQSRRRPTLPQGYPCSTMGPGGLNYRVRDGNGCGPSGMIAGNF